MSQPDTAPRPQRGRKHSYRRGLQFGCPHCDADVVVRSSEKISPTYRRALFECTNDQCGWRGTCDASIVETRTPSHCPRATVQLPLSPRAAQTLQRALDAHEAESKRGRVATK